MTRAHILAQSALAHLRRLSLDPASPRYGAPGHVGRASRKANAAATKAPSAEVRAWALRVAALDKVWVWRGLPESTRKRLLATVEDVPPMDAAHEILAYAKRLSRIYTLVNPRQADLTIEAEIIRPYQTTLGDLVIDALDALGVDYKLMITTYDYDELYFSLKPHLAARLQETINPQPWSPLDDHPNVRLLW